MRDSIIIHLVVFMKNIFFVLLLAPLFLFSQVPENQIFRQDVASQYTKRQGFSDEKVNDVILVDQKPVIFLDNSQFIFNGQQWEISNLKRSEEIPAVKKLPKPAGVLLSVVDFGQSKYAGTEKGLYKLAKGDKEWQLVIPEDEKYRWAPEEVAALVVDSRNQLWFASKQGVGCYDGQQWKLYTGAEGLPYNHFTCAAAGPDGVVWFGTEKGAIRFENGQFHYRFSLRWLPNDYVNGIAVQDDGTAWFATNRGVGKIVPKPISWEQKAGYFTWQTETRHERMGFIAPNELDEPYDTASFHYGISDNDGMYTSMYGAAQSFRYAFTGDKEAKKLAKRSFEACKWLVDITHEPGFPARVIVPHDWPEPLANPEYSHQMNINRQKRDPFWKDINPRFVKSKDGKYLWKCDTSSDELAGHYFFYGVYYDLVAETEEEKQPVREVVAAITDHLIRHGFTLVDHDGKPTRWGNFSPEFCNSAWGWDQRGLNSMMMLSFLNVAKHVTGDQKYEETAAMLRKKHNYHINAMHAKEFFPPENVVPWDNNLSLMSMFGLLNYEENPELLLMYRLSLEHAWLHISKQNNAFWNVLYASMAGHFKQLVDEGYFKGKDVFSDAGNFTSMATQQFSEYPDLGKSIKTTLQRIPMDMIGYKMDNTHRLDIIFDPTPAQDPTIGWRTDGYAVPVDERGHVRQDRDGFSLLYEEVGGERAEQEGTFFLLPYYMAQYYKLISK